VIGRQIDDQRRRHYSAWRQEIGFRSESSLSKIGGQPLASIRKNDCEIFDPIGPNHFSNRLKDSSGDTLASIFDYWTMRHVAKQTESRSLLEDLHAADNAAAETDQNSYRAPSITGLELSPEACLLVMSLRADREKRVPLGAQDVSARDRLVAVC